MASTFEFRQSTAGSGTDRDTVPLNARQERALSALLTSRSVEEAAKRSDVGVRTLYRWLAECEAFGSAYREVVEGVRLAVVARVRAASLDAIVALHGIVTDPQLRPHERIAAASQILEAASQLTATGLASASGGMRTILCYPVAMPPGALLPSPATDGVDEAGALPGTVEIPASGGRGIMFEHHPLDHAEPRYG